MEISVVVECMHRVQFNVASVWLVHDLSPYGSVFHECAVSSMSYLKAEHAFQVADSLSHNFPHVEESGLQESLYRYFLALRILDSQLRSEHISSPKARSVPIMSNMSAVSSHRVEQDSRHGSSSKLLVPARPETPLILRMTSALHTLQPRCSRFLQAMQVEANRLQRPRRCTGAAGVAGPYVLMQRDKCYQAILREEGE